MNNTTTFIINGKEYNRESFCKEFNVADKDFDDVYAAAKARGIVKESMQHKSAFDKFMDELNVHNAASTIKDEEVWENQSVREDKAANKCTYEKVTFSFRNVYEVQHFVDVVLAEGIKPENVLTTSNNKVVVHDITQDEYNKFALYYNTSKATNAAVRSIGKTATTATNIAKYTAENVASPIIKTGIRSVGMMAKTLVHTVCKTGSAIVSTAVDTASEAIDEIKSDPEVVKATSNLYKAKNGIATKTNSFTGKGIEIG